MVRPEDRFRQWRDGGDAEALAEVYDLAAPTLPLGPAPRPPSGVRRGSTPEPRAREKVVGFAVETPAATGPAGQRRHIFIETTPDGWRSGGDPPAGVPLLWPPALPPGHHVLAIRSRDYADTEVAAVVTARAVTDVHVWLQPR